MISGNFFLPYHPDLVEKALEMRKNPTPAEHKLWKNCLKGLKPQFLRQRPIDKFIVDFYCPVLKLVIELDGEQHFSEKGQTRDCERTEILKAYGIEVLRFKNREVMEDLIAVEKTIYEKLRTEYI
jgi:very-short-patch-repair endonuclease